MSLTISSTSLSCIRGIVVEPAELLRQIPTVMLQHGLEQVRAKSPDVQTNVTDKQIKSKVSPIRVNLKKLSRDCQQVPPCATPVKFHEIAKAFRGIF